MSSKFYVANTSKQHNEFTFWVPEQRRPFTQMIRAGTQELIYPQGEREVHESIIQQHQHYGIKPLSEIDRAKGFVGLCYQFDSPISTDRLNEIMLRNDGALTESSLERRKEAAAALESSLSEIAENSHNGLRSLEIEVVEEARKGVDTQVSETISIEKPGRRGRRG